MRQTRPNPASRGLAAIVATALAVIAFAGCDAVLRLGPTATLSADSVADTGSPSVDAGSEAAVTPSDLVCGLPPHGMAGCNACIESTCCDVWQACAASAECREVAACLGRCEYDIDCVTSCFSTHEGAGPEFSAMRDCSLGKCSLRCLPSGRCADLLSCCKTLTGSYANIFRACIAYANGEDEAKCDYVYDKVFHCDSQDGGQ